MIEKWVAKGNKLLSVEEFVSGTNHILELIRNVKSANDLTEINDQDLTILLRCWHIRIVNDNHIDNLNYQIEQIELKIKRLQASNGLTDFEQSLEEKLKELNDIKVNIEIYEAQIERLKNNEATISYKLYKTIVRKFLFESDYKLELSEIKAKIAWYYGKKDDAKKQIPNLERDLWQIREWIKLYEQLRTTRSQMLWYYIKDWVYYEYTWEGRKLLPENDIITSIENIKDIINKKRWLLWDDAEKLAYDIYNFSQWNKHKINATIDAITELEKWYISNRGILNKYVIAFNIIKSCWWNMNKSIQCATAINKHKNIPERIMIEILRISKWEYKDIEQLITIYFKIVWLNPEYKEIVWLILEDYKRDINKILSRLSDSDMLVDYIKLNININAEEIIANKIWRAKRDKARRSSKWVAKIKEAKNEIERKVKEKEKQIKKSLSSMIWILCWCDKEKAKKVWKAFNNLWNFIPAEEQISYKISLIQSWKWNLENIIKINDLVQNTFKVTKNRKVWLQLVLLSWMDNVELNSLLNTFKEIRWKTWEKNDEKTLKLIMCYRSYPYMKYNEARSSTSNTTSNSDSWSDFFFWYMVLWNNDCNHHHDYQPNLWTQQITAMDVQSNLNWLDNSPDNFDFNWIWDFDNFELWNIDTWSMDFSDVESSISDIWSACSWGTSSCSWGTSCS